MFAHLHTQMISLSLLLLGFCFPVMWLPSFCLLCRKDLDKRARGLNIASAVLGSVSE